MSEIVYIFTSTPPFWIETLVLFVLAFICILPIRLYEEAEKEEEGVPEAQLTNDDAEDYSGKEQELDCEIALNLPSSPILTDIDKDNLKIRSSASSLDYITTNNDESSLNIYSKEISRDCGLIESRSEEPKADRRKEKSVCFSSVATCKRQASPVDVFSSESVNLTEDCKIKPDVSKWLGEGNFVTTEEDAACDYRADVDTIFISDYVTENKSLKENSEDERISDSIERLDSYVKMFEEDARTGKSKSLGFANFLKTEEISNLSDCFRQETFISKPSNPVKCVASSVTYTVSSISVLSFSSSKYESYTDLDEPETSSHATDKERKNIIQLYPAEERPVRKEITFDVFKRNSSPARSSECKRMVKCIYRNESMMNEGEKRTSNKCSNALCLKNAFCGAVRKYLRQDNRKKASRNIYASLTSKKNPYRMKRRVGRKPIPAKSIPRRSRNKDNAIIIYKRNTSNDMSRRQQETEGKCSKCLELSSMYPIFFDDSSLRRSHSGCNLEESKTAKLDFGICRQFPDGDTLKFLRQKLDVSSLTTSGRDEFDDSVNNLVKNSSIGLQALTRQMARTIERGLRKLKGKGRVPNARQRSYENLRSAVAVTQLSYFASFGEFDERVLRVVKSYRKMKQSHCRQINM